MVERAAEERFGALRVQVGEQEEAGRPCVEFAILSVARRPG